ncbi:MAG: 50S ribosomal protein L29 [Phycisphaerae bacterium]|nr:50S ribosomal protein L29 [Phycisphaerae bacterium]
MKNKKAEEYRGLSTDELLSEVESLRARQFEMRTQSVTEKLEDPTQLTKVKSEIARILTVIREKELAAQAAK